MNPDPTILNELKELNSSLATGFTGHGYQVPASYFEHFAQGMLLRVKALESTTVEEELAHLAPLLQTISRQPVYSIPPGYFEELTDTLVAIGMDQSPAAELETISPLLSGLKKQVPYTLPAGYFETIGSPQLLEEKSPPAKVIGMGRSWMRYAAAAIVIAFVSVTGFFLLNKDKAPDPAVNSYAWVEKNMKKVSTDEINKLVELAEEEAPAVAAVAVSSDVKDLMKNVPDQAIQDFLNELGDDEADDDDLILN